MVNIGLGEMLFILVILAVLALLAVGVVVLLVGSARRPDAPAPHHPG